MKCIAVLVSLFIATQSFGQLVINQISMVEKVSSVRRGFSEIAYIEKADTSYTVNYYAECNAHLHVKCHAELVALRYYVESSFDYPGDMRITLDGEPVLIRTKKAMGCRYVEIATATGIMTFSEKEFEKLFRKI